jgi:hypothetical protein
VVIKALTREAEKIGLDPVTRLYDTFGARCHDALVGLCRTSLADDAKSDRAFIVVHASATDLIEGTGGGETEDGLSLAIETVQRLACGCRWQFIAESADGVVRVGRSRREPPPWLERQVRRRDQGCRVAGCGRRRWTQIHHIVHWTRGGATDLDNLIELCWTHHHLVHEGGWSIRGDPNHSVELVCRTGVVLKTGPPPLRPEIKQRLFGEAA